MEIGFIVIGFVLIALGFIGSFLPVLPGPPIAWLGLLISFFSQKITYGILLLVVTFVIMVVVTIVDFILPSYLTKKTGGTDAGSRGSTFGLIVGIILPLPIIGIIICPFAGALIFEMFENPKDFSKALKSAFGAFLGFLLGTGIKAIVVSAFFWTLFLNLMGKF